MILPFPVFAERRESIDNYELHFLPNGVHRTKSIKVSNYLFPMYYFKESEDYLVSTSVYALIHYKKRFIRNPKFQTTDWYRPTFLTLDQEIMRARTEHRRSTLELTDKDTIVELGTRLIQEYVSEIEEKYPGWVHIVLMGGKDSQTLVLADRKERWIVLSGEPNTQLNRNFIEENRIDIEDFVGVSNETNNEFLLEEIMASDCSFDVAHLRWVKVVHDLAKEHDGKVVLWMGTAGDGIFAPELKHRDVDYFAVHDLHVGTAMGLLHQLFKNLLDIPVLSPYQSPRFLDELFYRFDPYFVTRAGDVRPEIGELLLGRPVWYPSENPFPGLWKRNRSMSIPIYVNQLKQDGIPCDERPLSSWIVRKRERVVYRIDRVSTKKRSRISRVLVPVRRQIAKVFPMVRSKRFDMAAAEKK